MNINILLYILCFIAGIIISYAFFYYSMWTKYMDHGGDILIDEKHRINRFMINTDMEEWGSEKYIIFKVSTSQVNLKRLEDINPLNLEEDD